MNASIGDKISVCLLTYNHVEVIESTLQSILDQTITGYDVIVSDDCSTDGTWERILDIANRDARVKAIRTPNNMGMPGNANYAVAQSDRPYIALLHHDDIYRRDLLEKWAAVLDRHSNVSFVFNPYDDPPDPELTYGPRFTEECLDGRALLERYLLAHWGCPIRGTAMIRKSCWDKVGGMRERFNLVADVDLWMRLSKSTDVGYVPEPLIHVRAVRPNYYPDTYTLKKFHWSRKVLMYEIHASNILDLLDLETVKGRFQWWRFRLRVSCETARWLSYAVIRKKRRYEIISASSESATEYDLRPLRVFRRLIQLTIRPTED